MGNITILEGTMELRMLTLVLISVHIVALILTQILALTVDHIHQLQAPSPLMMVPILSPEQEYLQTKPGIAEVIQLYPRINLTLIRRQEKLYIQMV